MKSGREIAESDRVSEPRSSTINANQLATPAGADLPKNSHGASSRRAPPRGSQAPANLFDCLPRLSSPSQPSTTPQPYLPLPSSRPSDNSAMHLASVPNPQEASISIRNKLSVRALSAKLRSRLCVSQSPSISCDFLSLSPPNPCLDHTGMLHLATLYCPSAYTERSAIWATRIVVGAEPCV